MKAREDIMKKERGIYEKNQELVPDVKLRGHLNSVDALSFCPTDSSKILTGSHDTKLILWDLNKMCQIKSVQPHSEGIWTMKWLDDGKRVVSGSPDCTVSIFDISGKDTKPLVNVKEHDYKIFGLDVSKDEKLMVTCGSGSEIVFWDFNKMAVLKKAKANAWITYTAKFIEGTNFVATGASNGQCRLYNTVSFNARAQTDALMTWSRAVGFDWSHPKYNDKIYMGYEDGAIIEWIFDHKTKKFKQGYKKWSHFDPIRDIILAPKYDLMVSTARCGLSKIWNSANYDFYYLLTHHVDAVAQAKFCPDETTRILATASWDQSINIYKLPERLYQPGKPEYIDKENQNPKQQKK